MRSSAILPFIALACVLETWAQSVTVVVTSGLTSTFTLPPWPSSAVVAAAGDLTVTASTVTVTMGTTTTTAYSTPAAPAVTVPTSAATSPSSAVATIVSTVTSASSIYTTIPSTSLSLTTITSIPGMSVAPTVPVLPSVKTTFYVTSGTTSTTVYLTPTGIINGSALPHYTGAAGRVGGNAESQAAMGALGALAALAWMIL